MDRVSGGDVRRPFEADGVFGPNWFASVSDSESAQAIQDAVGGELRGFD